MITSNYEISEIFTTSIGTPQSLHRSTCKLLEVLVTIFLILNRVRFEGNATVNSTARLPLPA